MTNASIILKKKPLIEFQLEENGFHLNDTQTGDNSGFYPYTEIKSISLHKIWYPRLATFLRISTWLLNGVPYFPDANTCKKAQLNIMVQKTKLGIWITDAHMVKQAKHLNNMLSKKQRSFIKP